MAMEAADALEVERENGRGRGREIKNSDVWVPRLLVGIEERYRGWMDAAKLDIDERIWMTRIAYSLLRMNIWKHECEQPYRC